MSTHRPNNPDDVKRRQDEERYVDEQHVKDLKELVSSTWGRRLAWELIERTGFLIEDPYTGSSKTFHNEGRAQFGRELLREIGDADPEAWTTMMQEHYLRQGR